MNRELRELFDEYNIVVRKITLINDVRIVDTGSEKLVIKKREKDLKDLFQYLSSRSFDCFPKMVYSSDNYDVYRYIDDTKMEREEKLLDIVKLVTLLHNKTTFYKEIDDDSYKELYENIVDRIDYLYNYYNDIAEVIEENDYMSPSGYLFIRNISKLYASLDYARYQIDNWYKIIEDKKRVRVVTIHNNLKLEHYLFDDRPYLISWDKSKRDIPIYDIIGLYREYYDEMDFCDLFKIYEGNYPLLEEEKSLLFCLVTIPERLEFDGSEIDLCKKIDKFYNYMNTTDRLISDYFPIDNVERVDPV